MTDNPRYVNQPSIEESVTRLIARTLATTPAYYTNEQRAARIVEVFLANQVALVRVEADKSPGMKVYP